MISRFPRARWRAYVAAIVVALTASLLVAAPGGAARAEGTGSISGVVTDVKGVPIPDAWIELHKGAVWNDGRFFQGNLDGTFTFSGLAAGSYTVHFIKGPRGTTYKSEWWDDQPDSSSAVFIELDDGESVTGINAVLESGVTATGVVTDASGQRIAGAVVTAIYDEARQFSVTTNSVGFFSIEGLTASAPFTLRYDPPSDRNLQTEWYRDRRGPETADWIVASDGTNFCCLDAQLDLYPVGSSVPTVGGTPVVGSTLTAVPGSWAEGAVLGYRWFANGTVIAGATTPTLTLATAQKDKTITVAVTGTLSGFSPATRTSVATQKVATAATPKISGTAATGGTLTAALGTWTPGTSFAYQWSADGTPVAGATKATFVPKLAQAGKRIALTVTGTKAGFATVTRSSAATLRVTQSSTPKIGGALVVGRQLTAARGQWSAGIGITYQWYADGVRISGATKNTFKLTSAQRDKRITVKVTGKQYGYTTVTATSAATARVAAAATPTITGTYIVGSTLTAKPNTWTPGTSFGYQWLADGVPLKGATGSTLRLNKYHKDRKISVTVTGRKSGWSTVALTSNASTLVATVGNPAIRVSRSGSFWWVIAEEGTWTPGTTFSHRWLVDGVVVPGADIGVSGNPTSAIVGGPSWAGKRVTLTVTGKKAGYQTISRSVSVILPR